MPNEMIERVAAAIEHSYGNRVFAPDWKTLAKAAIAAMYNPTDAMCEAAVIHGERGKIDCNEVWSDMIDAALAD